MFTEIKQILKGEKPKPNLRGRYWISNMIRFYMAQIVKTDKRDENLWIFSCWNGKRYDDNSRSLFEYVNKYHNNEVRAVWLAMDQSIVDLVKSYGYEAYLSESEIGKDIQKKAGVVFCTNGLDDFGFHCKFYGAIICSMWHGLPLKHHYFAGLEKQGIAYYKNYYQNKIFSWTYRDISVTSSDACTRFLCDSFCIDKKGMALTGFPRNDIFREVVKKETVLGDVKFKNAMIVAYLPTYRNYEDSTIVDTIKALSDSSDFLDLLKRNNAYFLIKKHYLTSFGSLKLPDRIIVLDNNKLTSTQELLAISDLLITDYSSCIFDFSITDKPSIIYAVDIEKYMTEVGILDMWKHLYQECSVREFGKLKMEIFNTLTGESKIARKTTECVKKDYIDSSIFGSCYSQNVYEYVKHYQSMSLRKRKR